MDAILFGTGFAHHTPRAKGTIGGLAPWALIIDSARHGSRWNAIVATKSSYVCRVRDDSAFRVERIDELAPSDKAAGVQGDEIVIFGGRRDRQYPDHPVRLVAVKATPHRPRGRNAGPGCDGTLRIATSRLDLPAELISEIYRQRWLIEVFFRMFKPMLGCRPNVAVCETICFYLTGWASLEELGVRIAKY